MKPTSRARAALTVVPGRDVASTAESAAFRAIERADFATAKELLDVVATTTSAERARFEYARAQIARIESDVSVWQESATFASRHHPDPGARLAASALRVAAARRGGAPELADRLAADVERDLTAGAADDGGFGTYVLAVDAWEARRYDVAERLVVRNLAAGLLVAEAHALRAWIAVRRERYRLAGTHFARVLAAVDRENTGFRMRARAIHGALLIACDVVDLRLGRRARAAFEAIAETFPPSLGIERFNIERCLRAFALLEGDLDAAFVAARAAAVYAPTPAFAALAEVYSAEISRVLGDRKTHELHVRRAWANIREASWGGVDAEQRMALTTFALEAATSMPAEARKAITLYQSLRAKAKPQNALEDDRRVEAFDLWAAGRLCEALGDVEGAVRRYTESRGVWSELSYDVRAALVALDLERLTHRGEFRPFVEKVLARAPKAWIGSELGEPIQTLRKLRRPQLEVLLRLLEGYRAKAIARDLELGSSTIARHTRTIFAAFDVRSRDALVRACRAAEITPESLRARLTSDRPN